MSPTSCGRFRGACRSKPLRPAWSPTPDSWPGWLHQTGKNHVLRVSGGEASRLSWHHRLADVRTQAGSLARRSDRLSAVTLILLEFALAEAEAAPPAIGLPHTHIHGDLRLCHVLFTGDRVTGLLDIDQATWAERLVDVCYGAVSAPAPEGGAFLTFAEIQTFLRAYDRAAPFTPDEENSLKSGLLAALVELLGDLVGFLDAGARNVTPEDLERAEGLFAEVAQAPSASLLERGR